ncbi:MAG TPA: DUF917 family protein [Firmicutes bacterium]|jgi:DUF917 family protein|nr:DUF917 family protein [Candidatus Fermentithermobacillaceae bacterium]
MRTGGVGVATILNEEILQAAVIGGSFYGGGGGGSPALGMRLGKMALSMSGSTGSGAEVKGLTLVDLDDLPDDAVLLTVSAVGSPAGKGHHAGPEEYARAVEFFRDQTGRQVAGLITNECGGLATVNGWIQSAGTGLPLVDAPCNGRAHPTGIMGSMGLHLIEGYESVQAVVGGSREAGTYLEVLIHGSLDFADGVVRQAAAHTGGLVAVARNPVTVSYAREHNAIGAITRCIQVGKAMLAAHPGEERISRTAGASRGTVSLRGVVARKTLVSAGGFDTGVLQVESGDESFELTFWNEYITLEKVGLGQPGRLATFPDLIATLDLDSGDPVSSADVKEGQGIAVVVVPASELLLGAGVKDPGLYKAVEETVGKDVIRYVFGNERTGRKAQ